MVYVLGYNGKPLMPTKPSRAKKLLKQGKAKCIKRTPFTIKLTYETATYTQELILGIDTGSGMIGSAVVNVENEVIYLSQIEIRNDIADKMKHRSKYRRNRRNRKTRYRIARWLNRKNSIKKYRFSPTMTSKINGHLKEIKFVFSILPITKIILETATFDPHALNNPSVLSNKWLYQKGINYGFANTKAYVLSRDSYTCQCCKGKSKDRKLEVHHIVFRRDGGSDEESNLICLCKTCHDNLHQEKLKLKKIGKVKGQLNHATQMNSIRQQLLRQVDCEETFGFITKEHRQIMNLPKEHYMDAVVIASQGNIITFKTNTLLLKKCVSDGDYQQSKGIRSEQKIPTCKIQGFRKFDKVEYLGNQYFIKGRMSTGFAILMNIEGTKIDFSNAPKGMKTPKMNNMKRIGSRKSWIMSEKIIVNI
ncbi:RNA-guided endonuclease IscB [Clostridium tagluense]|uniref:RNA-guided endonuclease IscB n=1 Tax=Clostridium tagluense TaxID=360422 RepID=UPI001C0BC79F|nr:RNA-guided endonuclease IscB [Clostridium tagluense]MBU3128746.1 HNH endonuclease [Clostridium tagluense]